MHNRNVVIDMCGRSPQDLCLLGLCAIGIWHNVSLGQPLTMILATQDLRLSCSLVVQVQAVGCNPSLPSLFLDRLWWNFLDKQI